MSREIYGSDHENRPGNPYPKTVDDNSPGILTRRDMLYTYHNTVSTAYIGDIRHYAIKFGDYLKDSKSKVYDVPNNKYIDIPVKYAAPNLVFSDNMPKVNGLPSPTGVFQQASITDRIVLPVISYYMTDMKYDPKRAIDPAVRFRYKPVKSANQSVREGRVLTTHFPMPMNYEYQVDVWCDYREHYHQLLTAFQLDFNPYSYLYDIYDIEDETQKSFYTPYAKMTLLSSADNSNFIPGSERRVVRGTLRFMVEGWLTPPVHDVPLVKPVINEIQAIDNLPDITLGV
jgi:hypothetical protein